MDKRLLALAAIAAMPVSAVAADMAPKMYTKALTPAPVVFWTGFYGGVNAGGAFGDGSFDTTGIPVSSNPAGVNQGAPATLNALAVAVTSHASGSGSQFIGGAQFGYNFKSTSALVWGFEADIQGLGGSGRTANAPTVSSFAPFGFPNNSYGGTASFTERLDYFGTVRGRVGYLAAPSLLAYATGGLAYGGAHLNSSYSIQETFPGFTTAIVSPISGAGSASKTVAGWTAGFGLEWMFGPKWSAKFEYLYYDLGSVQASVPLTQVVFVTTPWATVQAQTSTRFDGSIVRVGVNYHLN